MNGVTPSVYLIVKFIAVSTIGKQAHPGGHRTRACVAYDAGIRRCGLFTTGHSRNGRVPFQRGRQRGIWVHALPDESVHVIGY